MRSKGTYKLGHKTSKVTRLKISYALKYFNTYGEKLSDTPWYKTLRNIGKRLTCRRDSYWKRGIRCDLTLKQLKTLWFRDKAYQMIKPSIDRIDNRGNYTFENCQYLEHRLNSCKREYKKRVNK